MIKYVDTSGLLGKMIRRHNIEPALRKRGKQKKRFPDLKKYSRNRTIILRVLVIRKDVDKKALIQCSSHFASILPIHYDS